MERSIFLRLFKKALAFSSLMPDKVNEIYRHSLSSFILRNAALVLKNNLEHSFFVGSFGGYDEKSNFIGIFNNSAVAGLFSRINNKYSTCRDLSLGLGFLNRLAKRFFLGDSKISIIVICAVLTNIILELMLGRQIGFFGLMARALVLVLAFPGLIPKAILNNAKNTSQILKFLF